MLARGTIAGVGEQNWVNLDGTWGNSGGPLFRVCAGVVMAAGILLSRAGDVNRRLRAWEGMTQDMRQRAEHFRGLHKQIEEIAGREILEGRANITAMEHSAVQLRLVLSLLDEHFRTGFLKFAAASDLRRLLA